MVTSTFAFSISIHAPREGGDFTASNKNAAESLFQSTPPARGATRRDHLDGHGAGDFNPRPPRGGRRRCSAISCAYGDFNPRPPRGGRRQIKKEGSRTAAISIHAPREGGDRSPAHPDGQKRDFNPRPPRGGRRRHICSAMSYSRFQSTPPARGATRHPLAATRGNFLFQSTPPARGATTTRPVSDIARRISIHAPREGGDSNGCDTTNLLPKFQSTPPARGATQSVGPGQPAASNFNPRPPRGGRL